MKPLPDRANLAHLKKQAKALIRAYLDGDPDAVARFERALPAAAGRSSEEVVSLGLRLHDAQSCLAREYGFASWANLASYVEAHATIEPGDSAAELRRWLEFVYAGDVTGRPGPARPQLAVRMLQDTPGLAAQNPYLACAVGDEAALRRATAADPLWINRAGGPLNLPPLVAVTHSALLRVADWRERLRRSAAYLLTAWADPNQRIGNRFPPGSLSQPDDQQPLSALYGAAGANHDPWLTALLLDAGADPNDGESLYHSLENVDCTRLLLQRGARVAGSNALYHALDLSDPAPLDLLLAHGGDANERAANKPLSDWGCPLLWAIRRRRSPRHVEALLKHGADPAARTPGGVTAYRLAMQFGLSDVAMLLQQAGAAQELSEEEAFVAACTRGDEAEARRIQAARPDLPAALTPLQLRLLPDLVAEGGGDDAAAMLMVRLGWPIAVRGGDWDASALNLAVFRGDPVLTELLLSHGASWREEQGYGDNVCGTLAWASCNEPVERGDWLGCARALLASGMPRAQRDAAGSDVLMVEGRRMRFSDDVAELLLGR